MTKHIIIGTIELPDDIHSEDMIRLLEINNFVTIRSSEIIHAFKNQDIHSDETAHNVSALIRAMGFEQHPGQEINGTCSYHFIKEKIHITLTTTDHEDPDVLKAIRD